MATAPHVSGPGTAEPHSAVTVSGYRVPVTWYGAPSPHATLLLMAALGVAARFYAPLAQALCDAGLNVALVEQRGHGDSALRPSRGTDFGFREALVEDIPAVMDFAAARAPGLPLYLMGHSLGGHYSAITAGRLPERVAGVVLAACGSPWTEAFPAKTRRQIQLLLTLIPLTGFLLGYYPGNRIGFGGREARTLMKDWATAAKTNAYRATGLDEDLDAQIARYAGRVLSLRMADDDFAPEAAMAAVTGKFRSARVTKQVLTEADIGDRADHFRWARTPQATAHAVAAWTRRAPD